MTKHTSKAALIAAAMFYLGTASAQTNIAPSAVVTGSAATGTTCYNCPQANDLNFGTCGTQQMFVWTSGPPSPTIGVDWIQWEWSSPQSFDELIIHHAQTTGRFLTGATMQIWSGGSWVTTGTFSGLNQANCVNSVKFPVVVTNKFRITQFVAGTGQNSNMNYREFEIIEAILVPDNAGATSIDSPAGGCEGTYNIVATIQNRGVNRIDSVRVNWSFNGNVEPTYFHTSILDTVGGALPNSVQIMLGTKTFVGGQTDNIKVWTSMPNGVQDTFNADDTVAASWFNLPTISTFPYYEDFEAGQGDWAIVGTGSTWAFGTPAKSNISGAASGINAFVTGGLSTASYNPNENSQVNSPCFDLTSFAGTPWVALDVNWYSESSYDGAALQASTDGGMTWENVGKVGDPNNWYTDASLDGRAGGSSEGWAGTGTNSSQGWKRAKHVLPMNYAGTQVRFRIAFGSDGSVQYDGFGFDNFTVVDFRELDLGPKRSLCGKPNLIIDPGIPVNGKLVWSTGDSTSPMLTVTTVGVYSANYTDTLIDESSYGAVEIVQSPAPVVNFARNMDTVGINDYLTLDPRLPLDLGYEWTPSGSTYPFYVFKGSDYGLGSHLISVKVTDSLYCTDEASVAVFVVDNTGIDQNEEAGIRLFPNPVTGTLNIAITNPTADRTEVKLFDMQGRMVYSSVYGTLGSTRIELDMSQLQNGTYLLQLGDKDHVSMHKLIKSN